MPLSHSQPDPGLARELREVARDAIALEGALTTGLNFELPPDFPRDQLVEIAQSLAQLPNGTGEGCRTALAYARNRLPAIRREHILSEELDTAGDDPDATPAVVRGELIDERLRHLIASVTTALDEYRRLAADETGDEAQPEAGVSTPSEVVDEVVTQSRQLETDLDDAASEVAETTHATSRAADDLKRQISDGRGLNRLARAELRMPRVVVGWYQWVVEALRDYPALISSTADSLRLGSDIAEIALVRWHEFHRNKWAFVLEEWRKTCDALSSVADKLKERKRRSAAGRAGPEDEFSDEIARAMVLAGRVPPAHWIPSIAVLEFGTRRLRSLAPLAGLTHLRSLTHVAARVSNLSPLAGLARLESLDLWGTRVRDLSPLAGLSNLNWLSLGNTPVANLNPIAKLTKLASLHLDHTHVSDVSMLGDLTNLRSLSLRVTPVKNVSPLSNLTNLVRLYLSHTKVIDLSGLAGLTKLERLDLEGTEVADLSPLARMTNLNWLNIAHTKVKDLSPLAGLPRLASIELAHSKVDDFRPLAAFTSLQKLGVDRRQSPEITAILELLRSKGIGITLG